MEITIRGGRVSRIDSRKRRKGETAQGAGYQGPRGSLTTTYQKITPAGIGWIGGAGTKIDQMPRLLCPTQTCAPRDIYV